MLSIKEKCSGDVLANKELQKKLRSGMVDRGFLYALNFKPIAGITVLTKFAWGGYTNFVLFIFKILS